MKCYDGINNVKVYNLTAVKNVPDWMVKKKRKRDSDRNDDELLQDFQMPDISTCIKLSPDGQYLMATGTYKPVLKCYDLSELCVKFERGMDADVLRIEVMGEDYSKIAFLQDSRYIELHGQNGKVDRLRVPRFGRDLCYHTPSADLFVSTSGNEIYRLNMAQGRFLNAIETNASGVNRLLCNQYLNLMCWGTDDGVIEYWDPRSRTIVASLNTGKHIVEYAQSNALDISGRKDLRITSLADSGAFTLGVGTQTGQILMYDIRSTSPHLIRDHHSRTPINDLHFHSSGNVFSMAPDVVKIWNKNTGAAVTSIEGESVFNGMQVVPNSGLVFFAAEHRKMKAYFVPSLGPAPRWCPHLDAMTEELENETTEVSSEFDDYTLVTREDLVELGLQHLIGSSMLRAYMHGYYISTAMLNKAKSIANPVKPQNVIKKKIRETIQEENTIKLKADEVETPVNTEIAKKIPTMKGLQSSRYASLFEDEELGIDEQMEKNVVKFTNFSNGKKQSDGFKKMKLQIQREEKELEKEMAESEESDADSVIDEFGVEKGLGLPSDDEEVEKRGKLSKLFRRGGKRARN